MTRTSPRYHIDMPTVVGPRTLKRLKRPTIVPAYQFTDGDEDLLKGLARHRLMSTEQAARSVGRSVRAVRARLYRMWADGLIERPEEQAPHRASFAYNGPPPLIYALARDGARLLQERGVPLDHRLDWTFRKGTTPALIHTLRVADVMLTVHQAVTAHGNLVLVDHHELLPDFPQKTRESKRPFSLAVSVTVGGKNLRLTNVPDRLFSVHGGNDRVNFALELDTGSETINPKGKLVTKTKATIRRKQTVYLHAFRQERFREQWAFQRLRVLFVVPSETRIKNMLVLQRELTDGRANNMFVYTTPERLATHGVFGPAWSTADDDNVSILPATFPASITTEPVNARA